MHIRAFKHPTQIKKSNDKLSSAIKESKTNLLLLNSELFCDDAVINAEMDLISRFQSFIGGKHATST